MQRRELFGVVGASAAGLAVLAGVGRAADGKPKDPLAECGCKCVEACCDAMNWCNEAYLRCSRQTAAGKAGFAAAGAVLLDGGELCAAAAKLVARESPLAATAVRACVEGCAAAAAESEKIDDPTVRDAVKSLKTCAAACEALLKAMPKTAPGSR